MVHALQILIVEAVQEDPHIDRRNLSFEIRAQEGKGIIPKIDEKQIQFANYDGKAKRRLRPQGLWWRIFDNVLGWGD